MKPCPSGLSKMVFLYPAVFLPVNWMSFQSFLFSTTVGAPTPTILRQFSAIKFKLSEELLQDTKPFWFDCFFCVSLLMKCGFVRSAKQLNPVFIYILYRMPTFFGIELLLYVSTEMIAGYKQSWFSSALSSNWDVVCTETLSVLGCKTGSVSVQTLRLKSVSFAF